MHRLGLILISVILGGCAAVLIGGAAAGAGGVAWYKGVLQQEFNWPLDDVYRASVAALKDLELPVTDDVKDKVTAKLKSEFADGTFLWIDLLSEEGQRTTVSIRVGPFGDQARSNRVLDAIEQHIR